MAKHRLQQPNRGIKSARGALIAGSITLGTMGMAAAPAMAAPITVPGVGTFEIPGLARGCCRLSAEDPPAAAPGM